MKFVQGECVQRLKQFVALLAYLCLAVACLGANPFKGETVGPFDLLVSQKAWTPPSVHVPVRNHQSTDVLDALLPRWLEARTALRAGVMPLWNPLPGGGESGIHNLVNGELTPAFAIFTISENPAAGFYRATLFDLVLIGMGCYLWLGRRVAALPAFLGGLTIMLCGFHAAWLYWPHTLTAMWIGWLLWSLDRWWERRTSACFLGIVAFTSLLLLGGFPFVAELGLGAALLYTFCLATRERGQHPGRGIAGVFGAIALAFAVCAIPIAELVLWLHGVDSQSRVGGSFFTYRDTVRLLLPWVSGDTVLIESAMYVGTGGLLLAAMGLCVSLRRPGGITVLSLFAVLLTLVGAVLVFELLPPWMLSKVPGLGHNPWSRACILLDLGMATLASIAADAWFRQTGGRRAAMALVLAVVLLQAWELGGRFRTFNGPVRAGDFYPATPIITDMTRGVTSFQSVVADGSFLVSGTLGAYGLKEWAAHAFKTKEAKALLSEVTGGASTTPTATIIKSDMLNLDSPVLTALAVKYVVGDDSLSYSKLEPAFERDPNAERKPLPPLPGSTWEQTFALPGPFALTGIRLKLATYGRTGLHGVVHLELRRGHEDNPLASAKVVASEVINGEMIEFPFVQAIMLDAGEYRFSVSYDGAAPDEAITAWYAPVHASNCSLKVGKQPLDGCMLMEWTAKRAGAANFKSVAAHSGIQLLENTDAPAGPYFLPSLHAWPHASNAAEVQSVSAHWQSLSVNYRGAVAGYVVIPMNGARDWRVTVNGKDIRPVSYLGVMPAIPVAGPASIVAVFEPVSIRVGGWIMLAAMVVLVVLVIGLGRKPFTRVFRH
jgi:hypothetical protein